MRHRYPVFVVCLALLALVLVGCAPTVAGALPPRPTAVSTPSPTPLVSPTAATPAPTASPSLTPTPPSSTPAATPGSLGDDGKTITMRVGDRFLLDLGDTYVWTAVPADPSILSRMVNVLTIRGSQGLCEAQKPGQTELTAAGDPPCRQSTPACAAPSRVFRVTVVVQP